MGVVLQNPLPGVQVNTPALFVTGPGEHLLRSSVEAFGVPAESLHCAVNVVPDIVPPVQDCSQAPFGRMQRVDGGGIGIIGPGVYLDLYPNQ